MKRSKRNMGQRAYERGYQTGISGRSREMCPHTSGEQRSQWMSGWHEGRTDQWDGYTMATACHKLSGF